MAEVGEIDSVTMTADGLVPIPPALREKAGLAPGGAVTVALNERGEVVLTAGGQTPEQRRDRFQSRLERSLDAGIARDTPAD